MPRSKSVITINFKPPATRWLLVLPALLALLGAWYAGRWCVGDVIAEYAPAPDEGGVDMARVAARWAPDDPLTHWRLASFEEKTFSAENLAAAVQEYQLAVIASPYDYRYWMELGRALETTGDTTNAEKALRRAVDLAPAYSHPRWVYGNFLLRQGRSDEAFAQLSRAADADDRMRPPVFSLAWQVFEGDLNRIIKAVPAPAVRLQFVVYLIDGGSFDEAARVLRSVNEEDRRAQNDLTKDIIKSLIQKRKFHAALAILREVEPDASELPTPEQIWNGGFEATLVPKDPRPFHWLVTPSGLAQISIDPEAHSGKGSLKIIFKASNKLEVIPVSQTIIVEPDTTYRLRYYQRIENLVSAATPVLAVNDPGDNSTLVASPALLTGTHDWQQITLDFKTKKTDGIQIGLSRGSCGEGQTICPIFGTVWYDDFDLQRISGPSSANRNARAGNK